MLQLKHNSINAMPVRSVAESMDRFTSVHLGRALRLQRSRFREGLAWYHLGPGCGIVNDGCHNRGGLHKIAGLRMIVDIHVGVMGARAIFQGILDELETGDADGIE